MKTIPQRELRSRVSKMPREVEAGERIRITVDGRPVADPVPVEGSRRAFVPREDVAAILRRAPLDRNFARKLARGISAFDATIDEL